MNLPSLDRYEDAVEAGGMIFYDSSLIEREVKRTDVKAFPIPATKLADENGTPTLANMIIMGQVHGETGEFTEEGVLAALKKVISAKRADMLDVNLNAMKIGRDY